MSFLATAPPTFQQMQETATPIILLAIRIIEYPNKKLRILTRQVASAIGIPWLGSRLYIIFNLLMFGILRIIVFAGVSRLPIAFGHPSGNGVARYSRSISHSLPIQHEQIRPLVSHKMKQLIHRHV